MASNIVALRVLEALQNDIGRGIVRIDSNAKKELGLSTGDFVRLSGKKATIAIVWQSAPEDEGTDIVRMDGILRQNAGVGLGDKVKVERAEVKPAKKVVLSPKDAIRISSGFDQYVKRKLIGKGVLKGNILPLGVFGTAIPLIVSQVVPQAAVVIGEGTQIIIRTEPQKELGNMPTVTYDDIGGLQNTIQKIREMVQLPLAHPELFERLGIDPPRGVMLYGPPGTGKTLLAKAVANESDANFYHIGGPEVVSKFVGESEEKIRKLFKEAEENAPSIIFIDEIDAIAPKRGEVTGEVERRMVSQLLTLLDGLKSRGQVIVIAATNRPESIDEALRRPGRFDREIEIGVPDREGREQILQIHTRNVPLLNYDSSVAAEKISSMIFALRSKGENGDSGISVRFENAISAREKAVTGQISIVEKGLEVLRQRAEKLDSELIAEKEKLKGYNELLESKREPDIAVNLVARSRQSIELMNTGRDTIGREINGREGELQSLSRKELQLDREKRAITQQKRELDKLAGVLDSDIVISSALEKAFDSMRSKGQIASVETGKARGHFLAAAENSEEKSISKFLGKLFAAEAYGEKIISDSELDAMNREISSDSVQKLVKHFASITHGYTGADLSSLVKEAALKAIRRLLPEIDMDEATLSQDILEKLVVVESDFENAMREIQPSALRELYVERPNIKWEDIGGLASVKMEVKEAVELPLKTPEVFERMGIRPIKGILLYGPPGTGKTMIAKAAAAASEANFISVKGSDLLHRHIGESAKLTAQLFKKARQAAPAVIFIDEIDGIAKARNSESDVIHTDVLNALIVEMDGLLSLKNVVVIAATNRPDILDVALLRAGRFDKMIELPVPDKTARHEILKIHTKRMPLEGVDLKEIAQITEGSTGADLENLVREAGMMAIREEKMSVTQAHFERALKAIIPSVKKGDVESLRKFKSSVQNMYG